MEPLPNVQHIHSKILKEFLEKGFDRTRPAVGICVKCLSEQGQKDLLEHNHRFTRDNKLLPHANEEALYGSLACSHLNMAIRGGPGNYVPAASASSASGGPQHEGPRRTFAQSSKGMDQGLGKGKGKGKGFAVGLR